MTEVLLLFQAQILGISTSSPPRNADSRAIIPGKDISIALSIPIGEG